MNKTLGRNCGINIFNKNSLWKPCKLVLSRKCYKKTIPDDIIMMTWCFVSFVLFVTLIKPVRPQISSNTYFKDQQGLYFCFIYYFTVVEVTWTKNSINQRIAGIIRRRAKFLTQDDEVGHLFNGNNSMAYRNPQVWLDCWPVLFPVVGSDAKLVSVRNLDIKGTSLLYCLLEMFFIVNLWDWEIPSRALFICKKW